MVAVELLADAQADIPETTRHALLKLTHEGHNNPLRIWAQIDGVTWLAQSMEEAERKEVALKLLILRRANHALLQRLFRISRARWLELRQQLNAQPPELAKIGQINESVVDVLYTSWQRLTKEFDNDIDRWVVLSTQHKEIPLASMYRLIYEINRGESA